MFIGCACRKLLATFITVFLETALVTTFFFTKQFMRVENHVFKLPNIVLRLLQS